MAVRGVAAFGDVDEDAGCVELRVPRQLFVSQFPFVDARLPPVFGDEATGEPTSREMERACQRGTDLDRRMSEEERSKGNVECGRTEPCRGPIDDRRVRGTDNDVERVEVAVTDHSVAFGLRPRGEHRVDCGGEFPIDETIGGSCDVDDEIVDIDRPSRP